MTGVLRSSNPVNMTRTTLSRDLVMFVPFGAPVPLHDCSTMRQCRCEVCTTAILDGQYAIEKLIWSTREIVHYTFVDLVVKKDDAVGISAASSRLGTGSIDSGVAGRPETMQRRINCS